MEFGTKGKPNAGPEGLLGGGASAAEMIKDATSASFMADVVEASRGCPVLVDFWAPWCGPCKQLTPVIEKVVRSYSGKVRLVKVNVDENQAIAAQLRIQSIPTVYLFRDGQPVDGFTGAQPEVAIRKIIDKALAETVGDDIASVIATGDELLEEGDLQGAVEVFAAVLQEDRSNIDAIAGLAQCYLKSGDIDRARQTLELVPPDKRSGARVQNVTAAITLLEKSAGGGDLDGVRKRVADNPDDVAARFDLAIALSTGNESEKAEALDLLLGLVRSNRTWNDDAARKQLLELFNAWGPKDPLVADGRRRLSAVLFS